MTRSGENKDGKKAGPDDQTLAALGSTTLEAHGHEAATLLRQTPVRVLVRGLRSARAAKRLLEIADELGATTVGELVGSGHDEALAAMLEPGERMWVLATLKQAIEKSAAQLANATTAWAPRGLSEGPAIDEPPTKAPALVSWARRHGLEDRVRGAFEALEPWLPPDVAGAVARLSTRDRPETILDCFPARRRRSSRGERARTLEAVAQIARMFLYYHAYERALARHRESLWQTPPRERELALLSGRLQGALAELRSSPHADEPTPFDHNPIHVDIAAGVTSFHFARGRGRTRLLLAGFEDNSLRVDCDCERGDAGCKHARLLLGWLLDAIHDPEHPLHAALVELVQLPTWSRLVAALEEVSARRAEAALSAEEPSARRLVWRVHVDGDMRVQITPVVQKRGKSRRWSPGRAITARSLAADENVVSLLERRDQAVLDGLLGEQLIDTFGIDARTAARLRRRRELDTLRALVDHPKVVLEGRTSAPLIRVREVPLTIFALAEPRADAETLEPEPGVRLRPALGPKLLEWDGPLRARGGHLASFDEDRGELLFTALDEEWTPELLTALTRFPAVFPRASLVHVLPLLASLQPAVHLEVASGLLGETVAPRRCPVLRLAPLSGDAEGGGRDGEDVLEATLFNRPLPPDARAPELEWPMGQGPEIVVASRGSARITTRRALADERALAESLARALGLTDAEGEESARGSAIELVGPYHWRIRSLERALDMLDAAAELARAQGLRVQWPEGVEPWRVVARHAPRALRVQVRSAGDWLRVTGEVGEGDAAVTLAALLAAARKGRRYVRVGAGGQRSYARIEAELRARLGEIEPALYPRKGRGFQDRLQAELVAGRAALAALQSLARGASIDADDEAGALLERLEEARETRAEPTIPAALADILRPYQREGVAWLLRLAAWDAGACLADEMGLGKTVQALAALQARAALGPALVIAPTSVLSGWRGEATRFTPELRARVYHGPKRDALLERIQSRGGPGPHELLITSYDVATRDVETLSKIEFSTLVLDEAHALKNARTRRATAIRALSARWRLALTGTPVENHLGELWSLLNVVSPGLLGSWDAFRDRFASPIERHGDAKARAALHRLLQPFLLRRVKAEVTPQLPPRTDVIHPVELSREELGLYEQTRRAAIAELAKAPSGPPGQENRRRFAILATITRLRRLACHPRLLDASSQVASSKLSAFLELSADLIADGHRALVFSQFTSHLALVREALDDRGTAYLYLDGSTPAPRRAALVTQWQEGQAPLFLISLKAGGTGLNLTAADYVIHLDPWWNPAVEDQASDRAHRLGQTRPVTVVRMVAQGTIEQQVIELHARKRALVESLLAGTDQAARLGVEELLDLVAGSGDEDDASDREEDDGADA